MSIDAELHAFSLRHGFGEEPGKRPLTVGVYTGCMLVPLPNIETRRRYLKYHDLHHLITGYSVGRIGEGEVSAWELGTGTARGWPMLGLMNLIALSTGLFLKPRRMWAAYKRGLRSRNLYDAHTRKRVDNDYWDSVATLRDDVLELTPARATRALEAIEFAAYAALALGVHAVLVLPAIVVRFFTDTLFGGGIFEAVKPKRRTDLF